LVEYKDEINFYFKLGFSNRNRNRDFPTFFREQNYNWLQIDHRILYYFSNSSNSKTSTFHIFAHSIPLSLQKICGNETKHSVPITIWREQNTDLSNELLDALKKRFVERRNKDLVSLMRYLQNPTLPRKEKND
jgi:hypothetical protein